MQKGKKVGLFGRPGIEPGTDPCVQRDRTTGLANGSCLKGGTWPKEVDLAAYLNFDTKFRDSVIRSPATGDSGRRRPLPGDDAADSRACVSVQP